MAICQGFHIHLKFILIVLLFLSTPISSADLMLASGVENPLPALYPDLTRSPAPSWVAEGVRVSYATIVTSGSTGSDTGSGITQLTIVGLGAADAAVVTDSYVPKPPYNTMHLSYSHGGVYPSGCGPFWVNPDFFADIPDQSKDALTVTRMPYSIGESSYNAIRFEFSSSRLGGVLTMIYDLQTGLLLYHKADFHAGSGQISMMELKNFRTMTIPWSGGTTPAWVTGGQTLSYSGAEMLSVEGGAGAPTQFLRSSSVYIDSLSDRFASLIITTNAQDITISQSTVRTVSGISQVGGIFLPVEVLHMGTGTFDQDPDTGIYSSVSRNDYSGVIITRTNGQDYSIENGYDQSGRLVSSMTSEQTTTSGFSTMKQTVMQLTG